MPSTDKRQRDEMIQRCILFVTGPLKVPNFLPFGFQPLNSLARAANCAKKTAGRTKD